MEELTATDKRYYFRPNFWPNTPDILTRELAEGGENNHIIRLILAATLSSNYGLYGPVYEFCERSQMPGKEEYINNEKYEIRHWEWDAYTRLKEIITRVNRIRKENPALHDTFNIRFAESHNSHLLCYAKADPELDNRMIIAVNTDPWNTQGGMVRIPLDHLGLRHDEPFRVRDLMSGDMYQWLGEWNYVNLNPHEMPAHIFKVEPVTTHP
jgi:starch synthase (maltosyl-transferring)